MSTERDMTNPVEQPMTMPNTNVRNDWPHIVLAGVLTLAYIIPTLYLMRYKLPDGAESIVIPLINRVGDVFMIAISWFYVSSSSSNRKTELLAQSSPAKLT